jgi:cytochrome P450
MRSLLQREDLPKVRETVAKLTKEQIARCKPERKLNVVSEISRMVPVLLTGEYFGFPGPDVDTMKGWSRATQYDMFHNLDNNEAIHQANIDAGKQMHQYLSDFLPQRKAQIEQDPQLDDTVVRLLKSHFVEEIHFDDARIMTNIMGLLVGGIETTSQAIVQILEQLFARPEQLEGATKAAKEGDNELLYQYCWEALRFNPINPFVVRKAAEDYRIASGTFRSKLIKKGSVVLVSGRSAMRDGRQVPAASSFCTDRPAYHYMHLGYGEHTCLGDQISRVQVPEIIKHLLLFPNVRQVAEADFAGGPFPEKYELAFD